MITGYLHRNPQIVLLILVAVFLAGASGFNALPRLEDPVLKQRVAVITVTLAGAGADQIETTVVQPIEQWLDGLSEIKRVRSNTRANVSTVVIELADRINQPDEVWTRVERTLQANADRLPDGCSRPELTIFPLKAFAAILAVVPESEKFDMRREFRIAKELQSRLLNLPGTESVELFGDPNEQLTVKIKPETLAETGLSTAYIAQQISNNKSIPSGNIQQAGRRISVGVGEPENLIGELENLAIEIPGRNRSIQLAQLATISIQPSAIAHDSAIINGRRSVVAGVMVDNRNRVDLWTGRANEVIRQVQSEFPGDYAIQPLFLQSDRINERMNDLLRNLALSTVAVVLIVLLFLGWRCMLVVAISVPLSACLVICGLRWLSIPVHQMSVTGLIVSLGLLIDNAIVMAEEVRSRVFAGDAPAVAVSGATRHLALPLIGSTLTTVLAFLPIAIMPGPSGEFVGSLAVSVILSISASLFFSLTVIPPLLFFAGVKSSRAGFADYGLRPGLLKPLYRKSLTLIFQRPWLGILPAILLAAAGFFLAGQLPTQFFPATDRAQIQIEIELPGAGNLIATEQRVRDVMQIVSQDESVADQHWFSGRSAPTFYYNVVPRRRSTPNYAQAFVDLTGSFEIDAVVNRLQTAIDAEVFDARVVVRKLEQGPPFDAPVEIRILGDDLQILESTGDRLRELLARNPNVIHTRADLGDKSTKIELAVDNGLARRNGISKSDLSRFVHANLEGADAGTFSRLGQSLPVRVLVDYTDRRVIDSLMSIPIKVSMPSGSPEVRPTAAGRSAESPAPVAVALGLLGDFELSVESGAIIRHNGQRVNEVKAYLRAGVLPSEVLAQIQDELRRSGFRLPGGCRMEIGGEDEKRSEAISTLIANVTSIAALMVLILVALSGTIRSALIIAAVAALATGLAPLALSVFGFPLGFMAIVGTMGLIGVAINDSIVVLAAIGAEFKGRNDDSEVAAARLADVILGSTRHILATTLTTMIGFLPLVIYGGKFWPPLAIVISAGVGGATLLALYFTPSLYLILHRQTDGDVNSVEENPAWPGKSPVNAKKADPAG